MRRMMMWVVCGVMVSLPALGQTANDAGKASAAAPEHPITLAQVHEMLQLTGAEHLRRQLLEAMMPQVKQAMPFLPASVLDDFQQSFEKADFEPIVAQSYQSHLSTEDAGQIIAFYKSPAGQRMVAAMPQIMRETQQAGLKLGQQTMSEVLQRHKAEIEAAAQKYQQEHSGSAPQQ